MNNNNTNDFYMNNNHNYGTASSIDHNNDNNSPIYASEYYPQQYPSLLQKPTKSKAVKCLSNKNMKVLIMGLLISIVGIIAFILSIQTLPNRQKHHLQAEISELYVSNVFTSTFNQTMNINSKTYRIFWFYNISNALDVLYEGDLPKLQLRGPFIYEYKKHLYSASIYDELLTFVPVDEYKTILKTITLKGIEGQADQVYEWHNPDKTLLRLVNPVLLGYLHQLVYNPLDDDDYTQFQGWCRQKLKIVNITENIMLRCIEERFKENKMSLNATFDGEKQGLMPLRTVSEWLGINSKGVDDELWINIDKYIRNSYSDTRNYSWAYFVNYTSASILNSKDINKYIRNERREYNPNNLRSACTYFASNGLSFLHDIDTTAATFPNVLNFNHEFAGWNRSIDFPQSQLLDGMHTHPSLDTTIDASLSIWEPELLRPLRFSASYPVMFEHIKAYRYHLDESNYNSFVNGYIFFSNYNDLLNTSQTRSYQPIFIGNPPLGYIKLQDPNDNNMILLSPSYMDIEQTSGMVINKATRYNYFVQLPPLDFRHTSVHYKIQNLSLYRNLFNTFISEERYQCNSAEAEDYRKFQDLSHTLRVIRLWGSVCAAVLFGIGLFMIYYGMAQIRKSFFGTDRKQSIYHNTSSALIYDASRK